MKNVRVATHVHSDWSYDGAWSLEALARMFSRLGYQAVLMAEHDRGFTDSRWSEYRRACAAASTAELRLIPGIEYSDRTNSIHVPVWGQVPFLGEGLETRELLTLVEHAGGVAILAHPKRRDAIKRLDPALIAQFTGVELWNRKYDGYAPSPVAADLLARHPQLMTVVSLDFHTARQLHPLAMVCKLADPPSEASVVEAISQRRVQATAFGLRAATLASGVAEPAMQRLEGGRRRAARQVRALRRRAQDKQAGFRGGP
jgi:hypothetical protein